MSGRSPRGPGGGGGQRRLPLLQRCLAIQLNKVALVPPPSPAPAAPASSTEFWMYDSGYLLFQSFLEANLKCFWNASLLEAMRQLQFQGYVAPGILLVTAGACALEVVRAAWSRNVLRPPSNYVITCVGDVESCGVQPLSQGQFTPLPEALCWVILELQAAGQPAVPERIRSALAVAFPDMTPPQTDVVYDALASLTADRKVYQTSQGYFVVTPERRRRRHSRGRDASSLPPPHPPEDDCAAPRQMLLSTDEALAFVHGEMATIRDGDVTHQAVQTNLADVVCGGNPHDKVLYARAGARRSSSVPLGRLERRHSLRLLGSRRITSSLTRCGSLRHLPTRSATENRKEEPAPQKKSSLLSRLFRRSGRKRNENNELSTFSAQFPPTEWFNPRVVHLHSIGTQTLMNTTPTIVVPGPDGQSQVSFPTGGSFWTDEEPATLPRRHRRRGDSASSITTSHSRNRSPSLQSSTLPRHSVSSQSKTSSISRSTSRTSVQPGASRSAEPSVASSSSPSSQVSVVAARPSPSGKSISSGSPKNITSINKIGGLRSKSSTTKSSLLQPSQQEESNSNSLKVPGSSSPPSSSGYSSIGQASSGRGSVLSGTSAPINGGGGSITVTSETPSATTMTTINGTNTKIYVQQQNSPVRSVITFENSLKNSNRVNGCTVPQKKDILVINGNAPDLSTQQKENSIKENIQRTKPERPTSLYSPKETPQKTPDSSKFPSVESLTCSEVSTTRCKLTNMSNSQTSNNKKQVEDTILHPNLQPPSTQQTSDLNNARVLPTSVTSPTKDGLSYKNVLHEGTLCRQTSKNNICSNPSSPTKTFGGSYGNLFIENLEGANKLNHQELFSSMKNLEENSNNDICTFPSLNDLTVHFKSIAAQKILKGVSINSIDTLVEVNMAAAEKQNNCDVTIHTDFGLV